MTIDELLKDARTIWGDTPMSSEHIALALGTVFGDICRTLRDANEGSPLDEAALKKELGNVIFSTIRWCDDLGYDPAECVRLAQQAQQRYIERSNR